MTFELFHCTSKQIKKIEPPYRVVELVFGDGTRVYRVQYCGRGRRTHAQLALELDTVPDYTSYEEAREACYSCNEAHAKYAVVKSTVVYP